MAAESDKPFNCPFDGCDQRFTNNDHLVIHQQKHELSLRLGGKTENLLVDQTPTPTRFLRNCEETGLFQELETNPFEQDFKQATRTDNNKNSDEQSISVSQRSDGSRGQSGEDVKVTARVTSSVPTALPAGLANPQKAVPMATAPAHIGTATTLTKQKLLASIQYQEQRNLQNNPAHVAMLAEAMKSIQDSSGGSVMSDSDGFLTPQIPLRRRGRKPEEDDPEVKRQRFLERNRAAASRCRARKKHWMESLEKKSKDIDSLNTSLQQEVLMLRAEVQQLKSILLAHKDCPLIVNPSGKPGDSSTVGVTLISQLAALPSLSPLIATHPTPSVGSAAALIPTSLLLSYHQQQQLAPDIGGLVEIPTTDSNNSE